MNECARHVNVVVLEGRSNFNYFLYFICSVAHEFCYIDIYLLINLNLQSY